MYQKNHEKREIAPVPLKTRVTFTQKIGICQKKVTKKHKKIEKFEEKCEIALKTRVKFSQNFQKN